MQVVPAHVWEAEVKAPTKKVVGLDLDDDEEDDYEDDDDDEELRGPLERYIEKEVCAHLAPSHTSIFGK